MANRYLTQFQYTHEKYKVHLECVFDGNSTSDPVLKAWSPTSKSYGTAPTAGYRGIKSVTRNGVGDYTITFQDTYQRLLGAEFSVYAIDESTTPVACSMWIKAQTTSSIRIITYQTDPASAVELTSNARCYLSLSYSNSATL